MVVDDSPIARTVLTRMICAHPDLEVVAQAGNAADALDMLAAIPVDIVMLDVEMPGTSGLDALPEILKRGGGARVMIVSSLAEDGARPR
jgi:two-component system chemotaxis response regulator CheB